MNIVPFDFEGNEIRAIEKDGEPWFVLADICRVLEHSNPSLAAARLDSDEKNTLFIRKGIAGNPEKTVVNESGLYSLILTSRKKEANQMLIKIGFLMNPCLQINFSKHMLALDFASTGEFNE